MEPSPATINEHIKKLRSQDEVRQLFAKLGINYRDELLLAKTPTADVYSALTEKTAEIGGQRGFLFVTADQLTADSAFGLVWEWVLNMFGLRDEIVVKLSECSKVHHSAVPDALRQ